MTYYKGKESFGAVKRKIGELAVLSSGFLLYAYASRRPEWVEEKYSRGLYPKIASIWGGLTSKASFSIAEFAVYIIALLAIIRLIRGVAWAIHENTPSGKLFYMLDLLLSGAVTAAAICFLVITLWGLNYNRLPFSATSGLDAAPAPVRVLERSCTLLAEQTNELREDVREDGDGVMALSVPVKNTLERAGDGYGAAAMEFEALGYAQPARVKPVLASTLMSYAGITGIYFPITAEANVNTDVTAAELPFAACHELAHYLGFAREDEANFIAWIACVNSPYEDFRYSGALMALTYLLDALHGRDESAYNRVRGACSTEVNLDLNAIGSYWQGYEGPVNDISRSVNDTYLKANGLEDGVQSYGRMADLVIAYFRAHGLKDE